MATPASSTFGDLVRSSSTVRLHGPQAIVEGADAVTEDQDEPSHRLIQELAARSPLRTPERGGGPIGAARA